MYEQLFKYLNKLPPYWSYRPIITERISRIIQLAKQEAQRCNRNEIQNEHLIIGLMKEGYGFAFQLLNRHIDLKFLRDKIESSYLYVCDKPVECVGLSMSSELTIRAAVEEAITLNDKYLGTQHLLLAMIERDSWLQINWKMNFGISREFVLAVMRDCLSKNEEDDIYPKGEWLILKTEPELPTEIPFKEWKQRLEGPAPGMFSIDSPEEKKINFREFT